MNLIFNNPFRILGVYSNSSARDIVANVNRAKAYINVGRVPEFSSDFNSFLPNVQRTLKAIKHAQSQINQTNNRIKYALFWFAKESTFDEIALGHLNANNIDKAKSIFEKHPSYSSLLNRGIIALIENDLRTAVSSIGKLIHEYHFRTDFLNAVCGSKVKTSEEELAHIFLDCVLDTFSATEVINAFDSSSNADDFSYIQERAVSVPFSFINRINEIERKEQDEEQLIDLYSRCEDGVTNNSLDDKSFSLCKSKSDYKRYISVFGSRALHAFEAEIHLILYRMASNTREYIKKHKTISITLGIIIAVLIGVGLKWGLPGYSAMLWVIGVISGFIALLIFNEDRNNFAVGIGCCIIAVISIFGANSIDNYVKKAEQQKQAEQAESNDYQSVINNPTVENCSSFLTNHPNSSHYNEVFETYYNCAQASGVESLENFAKSYSETKLGKKALVRVSQICDSLYNIALSANTIQGWREYQSLVPSKHYADSNDRIEAIENEAWGTESMAWSLATRKNTLTAYQKYLNLYPNGSHKYAADKKVFELQVASLYAGGHGELPAMGQTGGGLSSPTAIENIISHTLTLLYSGLDSRRVVVLPNDTSSVILKNGSYPVAAPVSASDIENFTGTHSLQGGSYNVQHYYIVTPRY